ncbi:MAG: hypothetical protein WCR02_05595 [Sphaerochaetaceae bacterium]|jgi:hypothetical protein
MSRRIDYLVQDLTDGSQRICTGRESLLAVLRDYGFRLDKNKLSEIHQLTSGIFSFSLLSVNNHDISVEELFVWPEQKKS